MYSHSVTLLEQPPAACTSKKEELQKLAQKLTETRAIVTTGLPTRATDSKM
jgi:hypothetical protein